MGDFVPLTHGNLGNFISLSIKTINNNQLTFTLGALTLSVFQRSWVRWPGRGPCGPSCLPAEYFPRTHTDARCWDAATSSRSSLHPWIGVVLTCCNGSPAETVNINNIKIAPKTPAINTLLETMSFRLFIHQNLLEQTLPQQTLPQPTNPCTGYSQPQSTSVVGALLACVSWLPHNNKGNNAATHPLCSERRTDSITASIQLESVSRSDGRTVEKRMSYHCMTWLYRSSIYWRTYSSTLVSGHTLSLSPLLPSERHAMEETWQCVRREMCNTQCS